VARQKLIFSGKVLVDESTIGETGVTERDFLVIMATKEKIVKPSSSTSVAAAAPAPLTQPQAQAVPQQLAPPAPIPATASGHSFLLC
jgi:UV excision repair protein RAD23